MSRLLSALCAILLVWSPAFGGQIHEAAEAGDVALVTRLLDGDKALLESDDGQGWTPLHTAANAGTLQVCRLLIERGASVNHQDRGGNTALSQAACQGHTAVVELLLKSGAKLEIAGNNGWTPIHWGAVHGHLDVCKALLAAGADLNHPDAAGNTPLTQAALQGDANVVQLLLQHGSKVDPEDGGSWTPLHFGAYGGNVEACRALIAAGADVNHVDKTGYPPIVRAASEGRPEVLKLLLDKGAKTSIAGTRANTAAIWAATKGDVECLKILVAHGVSLNTLDHEGRSALHYAVWNDRREAVRYLIDQKADLNAKGPYDVTPLAWAVERDRVEIAQMLLAAGANTECRRTEEGNSMTPLLYVAKQGSLQCAQLLLEYKAKIGAADKNGKQALHYAAARGELGIAGALLKAGADPKSKDAGGDDAHAYAAKNKQPGIAALLSGKDVGSDKGATVSAPPSGPIGSRSLASRQLIALGGADTKARAPLQLGPSARPRVVERDVKVQANPRTIVEFSPVVDLPDFQPDRYYLVVNGEVVKSLPVFTKDMPAFSFEVPPSIGQLTRLRIVAEDAKKARMEVQRAEVRTANPENASQVQLVLEAEKIVVKNAPENVKAIYVFAGNVYVGQLLDSKTFAVDARRIPAGQHEFYIVAQNGYGDLLPPVRSLIEIKPRYTMASPQSEGVFAVEKSETAMTWTFTRLPNGDIAKTRVYLRGTLVAESDKPVFDVSVPLADVPSGTAELQVIGVAADGSIYAPESRRFSVRNPFNDALVAHDERGKKLQEMISQMSYYDQQVVYWYSMAVNEPAFRTYTTGRTWYTVDEFGRMSSIGYLHSFTVEGHAQEYFAKCEAAIVERAQARFEIGKLQKLLGLKAQARSTFEQVIYEVGAGSGLGLAAAQELAGL